jgi:hypothetical protein
MVNAWPQMDRYAAPRTNVFCYYGIGLSTDFAYEFSGPIFQQYVKVNQQNGDDNQDFIDNTFCENWRNNILPEYQLSILPFPGVTHMGMSQQPVVFQAIYNSILLKF